MRRLLPAACVVAIATGCYVPPEFVQERSGSNFEASALTFQAVDAGTGSALSDAEMTVRYLVRAPILLDFASVETVPTVEPYRIEHDVSADELVVEVRVESDSYHRLDTVISVPRGGDAGPLTMRLSRRLGVTAQVDPEPEPDPPPPANSNTAADGEDRDPLDQGMQAFRSGNWLAATEAFLRMPAPIDDMSAYGRDYLEAKTNQGIAHINRSEYARALEVLEEAAALESPGPNTYLRLAEAQCAVGRAEEGRGTLAQLSRARNRMTPTMQNFVTAMIEYRRGICTYYEFDRAETTRERVRSGAAAMTELEGFVEAVEQVWTDGRPPEVDAAIEDARRRVETIRRTVGGRGGG